MIIKMEQAIKLAIKGGFAAMENWERDQFVQRYITTLPVFWQSLGKAMGWNEYSEERKLAGKGNMIHLLEDHWFAEWHHFIDHLAEGGNADDFFNQLLNGKTN